MFVLDFVLLLGLSFYLSSRSKSRRKGEGSEVTRRKNGVAHGSHLNGVCPVADSYEVLDGGLDRSESRCSESGGVENEEARSFERASWNLIPAATYSPTQLPVQYHQLRRA